MIGWLLYIVIYSAASALVLLLVSNEIGVKSRILHTHVLILLFLGLSGVFLNPRETSLHYLIGSAKVAFLCLVTSLVVSLIGASFAEKQFRKKTYSTLVAHAWTGSSLFVVALSLINLNA